MEVPKRGGSVNYGPSYEHKLTALFSLRFSLLEDLDKFWIASNVDHVGDFDDIVMSIKSKNGPLIAFMIQLKHKETQKLLKAKDFTYSKTDQRGGKRDKSKEGFSIEKYFNGFEKFQKEFSKSEEDGDLEFFKELRKVDKIILVLYTNKGVVDDCNFLQKSNLEENFFDLLDTNDIDFCYGFDHNKLNYDSNFLQKMRLFASQLHATEVDKLIEDELKKILGLSFPIMVNFKEVVEKYIRFVKTWIKGYKIEDENKYYTLTKEDVRNTLVGILFDAYKYDFSKEKFSSYDNSGKFMWNQLMIDQVVTVVNFSEKIVKFLQEYFGSEILKSIKSAPRMWSELLVKKQQERFLRCFGPSKVAQICQNADLSPLLAYKYLWMSGNVPLLLQINDEENFANLLKILKVSKSIRVIILVNNSISIPEQDVKIFSSLQDLSDDYQNQILDLNVSFQGRICVPLKDLVEKSIFGSLKCHHLIKIFNNNFNIGNKFSAISEYFVSQSVSKVFLKVDVLDLQNETFVIETKDAEVTKKELKKFMSKELKIYFVPYDDVRETMKTYEGTAHRLEYKDGYFEWKESLGDISNLKKYKIKMDVFSLLSDHIKTQEDMFRSIKNKNVDKFVTDNQIRVISGCPGMGKSNFLDFLSLNTPRNFWVFKIKLADLRGQKIKFLDNLKKILNFFESLISDDSEIENASIALAVYKKFLKAKKLLILLDGFDEISYLYKKEATEVIKVLQKEGFTIFITTREHMQEYLETTFNVLAINLKPFTQEEQNSFLTAYFKANISNSNEELVVEFVERLLKAAKKNLNDRDGQFTGIPLQTRLLADVFLKDCKRSLKNNLIQLNERFDLYNLYNEFFNQKTEISCIKFGECQRDIIKMEEDVLNLCALKCVFNFTHDTYIFKNFDIDKKLREKLKKYEIIQREGIVIVKINENREAEIYFVHQTFAEVLVAKYLSENYNSDNDEVKNFTLDLIKQRLNDHGHYTFLFMIFDRILAEKAENCPLLSDIINCNYDKIKIRIDEDYKVLLKTDDFGRTGLHMLALYGEEFQNDLTNIYLKVENFNSSELVVVDKLNLNALDYCFSRGTWTLANILCTTVPLMSLRIFDQMYNAEDFQFIFPTIFHNYLIRDLLVGEIQEDTLIYDYCIHLLNYLEIATEPSSRLQFVQDLNVVTVSQYLIKYDLKCFESGTYKDIRFAVAFGSKANVEELFSSPNIKVNERDSNNDHTLLHYAVYHNRSDIFDFLLENGSDVNIPGRKGDTVAHLATIKGYDYVIENILDKIKNFNFRNDDSHTALDYAFTFRHFRIAKKLISKGAKMHSSIIHDVAEAGDTDLLLELLKQNFDINYQSFDNKTALHKALENNKIETAKLLIKNNINLSSDNANESYMHLIAKIGNEELFHIFLSKGFNIDKINELGETPLITALSNQQVEFAKFLISKGASTDAEGVVAPGPSYARLKLRTVLTEAISLGDEDIIRLIMEKECDVKQKARREATLLISALKSCKLNVAFQILKFNPDVIMANNLGTDVLHLAASKGYSDVVKHLLEKGFKVNSLTARKETPLMLALDYNHVEVARLLISCKANVLIEDECQTTPLHHAAEWGHKDLVMTLVERGAHVHVNKLNLMHHTPLSLAIENDHFDIVNYLLSKGGDLTVKLENDETILHLAAQNGNNHVIDECIKLNMNVNKKSIFGKSPLFKAISSNRLKSAELLIEKGADIYTLDDSKNTILHLLAEIGNDELLLKFLNPKFGLNLNAVNDLLETPLCVALKRRNSKAVKLLLERKIEIGMICEDILHYAAYCGIEELLLNCLTETECDVNKLDNKGDSPLVWAVKGGSFGSIKLLLENGARFSSTDVSDVFFKFIPEINRQAKETEEGEDSEEGLSIFLKIMKLFLDHYDNNNNHVMDSKNNETLDRLILQFAIFKDMICSRNEMPTKSTKKVFKETWKLLANYGADYRIIGNFSGKLPYNLIDKDISQSLKVPNSYPSNNFFSFYKNRPFKIL